MSVLVVESEEWIRDLLVLWLEDAGFDVMTCPGPRGPEFSCAGATKEGCPLAEGAELIVLDLELESDFLMCGVAGWELLHYYRSLDKPVVVLTGFEDAIRPLPSDRIAVLPRPPDRDGLVEAIRVLLLTKELHPTPERETIQEVEVAGVGPHGRTTR
ncbi:MAG TPA: response regulator [Actinomycetota bacterium]|nr:response regulator [Actinomycetota bacterium]